MARNLILGGGAMGALLLALLIWWLIANQEKAYLHVCTSAQLAGSAAAPQGTHPATRKTLVVAPNGVQYWLGIAPEPAAQCDNVSIAVDAASVTAIHPVAPSLLQEHGNELHLRGVVHDDTMTIYTTQGKPQPEERPAGARRDPAPMEENLLSGFDAQPFGAEERARIIPNRNGRLSLTCTAGDKPAGAVLNAPWFLPQAEMDIEVVGSAVGPFTVSLIDELAEKKETARQLGTFNAAVKQRVRFHVPHRVLDRGQWRAVAFTCPQTAGQLDLTAVRLVPKSAPIPDRATWVWEADDWKSRPADVFALAEQYRITTLYIPVEVQNGSVVNQRELAAFVREATQQGRQVWPVDGDPQMVLPGEHAATVARLKAYSAYNQNIDPSAKISGVQFDIEPYLMDDYDAAPEKWDQQYLTLAKILHESAKNLPLEMAVPFWWGEKTEFLDALAPFVTGLNVMNYRTRADEIYRFAVPFLDWGARHDRKVRIALESGPVEAQTKWSYTLVGKGETWLLPVKDMAVLLQLQRPQRNPHGPAFALQGTIADDSGATTFHKKQDQMIAMLPDLERFFSAWKAFSGMALHEVQR